MAAAHLVARTLLLSSGLLGGHRRDRHLPRAAALDRGGGGGAPALLLLLQVPRGCCDARGGGQPAAAGEGTAIGAGRCRAHSLGHLACAVQREQNVIAGSSLKNEEQNEMEIIAY